jgi:hypothetical protein
LPGALLGSSSRSSRDRFGHNRACANPEHTRQTASTPTRDPPPSSAALTTAVLGTWSSLTGNPVGFQNSAVRVDLRLRLPVRTR